MYHAGDAEPDRSQIQCTPIVIDGVLYGTSPRLKAFALDAASGRELWTFDPFDGDFGMFGLSVNRGVTYWANGGDRRILFAAGQRAWIFRTIPHPGEFGYDTWPTDASTRVGGANNWAGMTVDDAAGLVFVPTGSATPDFFGGDRLGANLFANTLLALDASTGERV